MAKGFVHTVPTGALWRNRVEAAELLPGAFVAKADATTVGCREARRRKTEHVIHNRDGTIARRNSYGYDLARRPD